MPANAFNFGKGFARGVGDAVRVLSAFLGALVLKASAVKLLLFARTPRAAYQSGGGVFLGVHNSGLSADVTAVGGRH